MLPTSFSAWIHRREPAIPEADRVVPLIAQAGARGMDRGEIGGVISLERDSLDRLLDGLVGVGMLTVRVENGVRVYRARIKIGL